MKKIIKDRKTAVIYSRSATRDPGSILVQEISCATLGYIKKFSVVKSFTEYGSGLTENSKLLEAINYCRENNIDNMLVRDYSRISRDHSTLKNVISQLGKTKVLTVSS